jgi:toxin ParE1/3/4
MVAHRYSEPAVDDIEQLIIFTIKKWGRQQAQDYFNGLEEQVRLLAKIPKLGKLRAGGLRAFPYRSHILYYLKDAEGITVARVLHSNMDPNLHLG